MKTLLLSPVDLQFALGNHPIEMLFFYPDGLPMTAIRRAMAMLADVFWPLFGVQDELRIVFDRYDESAVYGEEQAQGPFLPADSETERHAQFAVYSPTDMPRLFYLKAVRFSNGIGLIPKMQHLAGDGYSYFFYLSLLAMLSGKSPRSFRYLLTRTLLRPRLSRRPCGAVDIPLPAVPPPVAERHELDVLTRSRQAVELSMKAAARMSGESVTANDVLSAEVVKRLSARVGTARSEDLTLTMPIDVRRRVKGMGSRFIGNGLYMHRLTFEREQIAGLSVEEIAAFIRASMPTISPERFDADLKARCSAAAAGDPDAWRPFDPDSGCLTTNISRLPTHRLDFGSGPPAALIPLTVARHSAAIFRNGDEYRVRLAY